MARPKKLVLAVIDAMKPAMLEQAIASGRAPTLELLMQRGHHTGECVAAFPSVTPVCSASIDPLRVRDRLGKVVHGHHDDVVHLPVQVAQHVGRRLELVEGGGPAGHRPPERMARTGSLVVRK